MRVFISYHTPDLDKARAVEAVLAARRPETECYLAPRNMTAGAYWMPALAGAIARADAVLFLAGSRIGPWQELEYQEALHLSQQTGGRPRIVPIIMAAPAPGLPFFAQLHQIFAADPAAPEHLAAIERALEEDMPAGEERWRRFQPYKGLPALQEADAAFFFGREDETAEILDALTRRSDRIIALIGQSGVGKSSLARAGVMARLKSQAWPLEAGGWPAGLRDSRAFLPLVARPGEQPLKELALAFAKLYCTRSFEIDEEAAGWARRFAADGRLADMLRLTRDRIAEALDAEPPKRFFLYLDQGEELYTRPNRDEARRFSALLAEAAGHEAFSVLMSLRSDYYAAFQSDRDLFAASERVDVLPMSHAVLIDVTCKPALTLGARFESDEMAPRVTEATESEPGALPLLSDLLHDMWLSMQSRGDGVLRWSDNPEIVDVSAPLRKRAEAFLATPGADEETVRRLFTLRLAQVPEIGEPLRRRARKSECGAAEWDLAEKLADEEWRLLTLARDDDEESVAEVAHEQLLRRWPRLKDWLEDQREFLSWRGQVENAAAEHAAAPAAEKDSALLMGRRLAFARSWYERRLDDLAKPVQEFIRASLAADEATRAAAQRLQRRILQATTTGLVVALGLVLLAGVALFIAEQQRNDALIAQSRFLTRASRAATADGDAVLGALLALAALPASLENPERPFVMSAEAALEDAIANRREKSVLAGHEGTVISAVFSPDGKRVVTASLDKTARLWDADTGAALAVLRSHEGTVFSAVFSPDGKRVVTASFDHTARLWDADTGAVLGVLRGHQNGVESARFSPDGGRVVTASLDKTARLWDAATGAPLGVLRGHDGFVVSAAFSPDGKRVATASLDRTARLWDADTGAELAVLRGHEGAVSSATFSPDGKRVVTASLDKTARLWDADTGAALTVLHGLQVLSAAFSPDGKRVLTALLNKKACLWDADTGAALKFLHGHEDVVNTAVFSPDGKRVLTASLDKTARLWDADTGAALAVLRGHESGVSSAAFSPDGKRVVTASVDNTGRLWDADPRATFSVMRGHEYGVNTAAFSPDGKRMVTAANDKAARLWDADTGAVLTALRGHDGQVMSAEFSPDGKRVVTASADKTARLWDAATGDALGVLRGHENGVNTAAFSPDGKRVVTASWDKTVRLWDAVTGAALGILGSHEKGVVAAWFSPDGKRVVTVSAFDAARLWDADTGAALGVLGESAVRSAAFSPDGKRVVTASSSDKTARLWDTDTGGALAILRGHDGLVTAGAFSPDGKRVVTGSWDETARLWDAATGVGLVTLRGHEGWVTSAAFSPDGKRVVTASFDKTARVWELPPRCQALIDTATAPAPAGMPRSLSEAQREENFLETRAPGPFTVVYSAVRPVIAWLLPSADDKCE